MTIGANRIQDLQLLHTRGEHRFPSWMKIKTTALVSAVVFESDFVDLGLVAVQETGTGFRRLMVKE